MTAASPYYLLAKVITLTVTSEYDDCLGRSQEGERRSKIKGKVRGMITVLPADLSRDF